MPRLTDLKRGLVSHRAHLPTSLQIDWKSENLLSKLTAGLPSPTQPPAQGLRFDVILISEQGGRDHFGDITQLASLPIESLAAIPSFLFLWLPNSDLLEIGRALLQRWGFRRAEDIVWVKTNRSEIHDWRSTGVMPMRRTTEHDSKNAVFVRTKEHCLMGIRGTVRRSVCALLSPLIRYFRLITILYIAISTLTLLSRRNFQTRRSPRKCSVSLRIFVWEDDVWKYLEQITV